MDTRWNVAAMIVLVPGFLLQCLGMVQGRTGWTAVGTALLIAGLALHFKVRGHSAIWSLWGLVPVLGVMVCLSSQGRDRRTSSPGLDQILIQEEVRVRPVRHEAGPVIGGRSFLLVMVPVGLLVLWFGPRIPYVALHQEPAPQVAVGSLQPPEQTAIPQEPAQALRGQAAPSRAPEDQGPPPPGPDTAVVADRPVPPLPSPAEGTQETPQAPAASTDSSTSRFMRIQMGMSYEQVCDIIGHEGQIVSTASPGNELVQWRNPDGSYFAASFRDNRLHRTTGLHFPPPPREPQPKPAGTSESKSTPTESPYAEDVAATPYREQIPAADEETAPEVAEYEDAYRDDEKELAPPVETVPAERPRVVVATRPRDKPTGGRMTYKRPRLPRFVTGIKRGPHDVHIFNNTDHPAEVGLRSGKRGKDFVLPPWSGTTLFLPNGTYTLYYLNASEPDALRNAGGFTINSPTEGIYLKLQ